MLMELFRHRMATWFILLVDAGHLLAPRYVCEVLAMCSAYCVDLYRQEFSGRPDLALTCEYLNVLLSLLPPPPSPSMYVE